MRRAVCHVVGAGEFHLGALAVMPGDMLIAADGGMIHLKRLDLTPDLLVGDFDSLAATETNVPTITLPTEKDMTDTMAALEEGLKCGHRAFALYGGMGGRFDHTLGNVQALVYLAEHSARGLLIGDGDVLTGVHDGQIAFPEGLSGYISVFCLSGEATGVTLKGLKYPLEDATLRSGFPIGVSNEFTGIPALVSVNLGTLVVYWHQSASEAVELLATQP